MKQILLGSLILLSSLPLQAQQAIEITDQTLKISGEEYLYYGFAEGDQVIFSLEEVDGKKLKEVEVLRYPDQIVYANLDVDNLQKTLRIAEEGVYQFRLKHSGLGNRLCHLSISRIPAAGQTAFDTTVDWVEKASTEAVIVGYETRQVECVRKVVAQIDTTIATILQRTERVHSSTNLNGNDAGIRFSIPVNTYAPNANAPYRTTATISWAYAIATGTAGEAWYQSANTKAVASNVTKTMISTGLVSTGYGALALLAIEGVSMFTAPPTAGDNVRFAILDGTQRTVAEGDSVAAFGKMTEQSGGSYTLQLTNDNLIEAINVDVKIIAVLVTTTYEDEPYLETQTIPIKEQKGGKSEKVLVPVVRG